MDLNAYNIIIINSSGGKDSLCAIYEICRLADEQSYPKDKIVISHQDLGRFEWNGTKELVQKQADFFGLKVHYVKRRNEHGYEENLLEYVKRRGKWPSNVTRYCTSDFKRGPGSRVVTMLTKSLGNCRVLHVFGFRKDESPARAKKQPFIRNQRLSSLKRNVYDYLPIHHWNSKKVWETIKDNKLPYHFAYDLGMPRLSCIFCIFSPKDALVIAGIENPELLDEYIEVEKEIDHTFQNGFSLQEVRELINSGYKPKNINDWIM